MKTHPPSLLPTATLLALLLSMMAASAQTNLLLTEFMAANNSTLADEDGQFSDWIEIYNPTVAPVNLDGWYLTDESANLIKWRFPATNIAANSYMIIFASNKDRRVPGRPLHTNFRLDAAGEYLALVMPDGVTKATEYGAPYAVQVPNISYGIPVISIPTLLVTNRAPLQWLVPMNDALGTAWKDEGFDDSAWSAGTNGIGYETDGLAPFTPVTLADSVVEFSGVQGQSNWFYGYWDKRADMDGTYNAFTDFTQFPRSTGAFSATNMWDGTKWDWFAGNPPWVELSSTAGHPSGDQGVALPIHWAIRRYVSETNGLLRITGTMANAGACGDGTICRIFLDGTQVYQQTVFGTSVGYSVVVLAQTGSLIDFAIDSGLANNDGCDSTTFTAVIRTTDPGASVVADTINDWSFTGTQGEKNWFYGYYNKTADLVAGYQPTNFTAFPHDNGPSSANNFWNGTDWNWFAGDPPWTEIGQIFTHPNGVNNAVEHWTIRRWVAEVGGTLTIDWHIGKQNPAGSGVTGTIFHNGAQKDTAVIAGNDSPGTTRTVTITNVQIGDFIDIAHTPIGIAGATDDGSDGTYMNATIYGLATLTAEISTSVQSAMKDVNSTAYLRIPFTVGDPSAFNALTLRVKYDDGYVAFLNGVGVANRNGPVFPDTAAWDSTATAARLDGDAVLFENIDLTSVLGLLHPGTNLLAIQGLNISANDSDFLIQAELRAASVMFDTSAKRYFATPTPGAVNGIGNTNLGPLILEVNHAPNVPLDNEDLYVTAKVSPTFNPLGAMTLTYKIMYLAETNVAMFDDGLHQDGVAGDGIYGGVIPNAISSPGQMIRYYVTAADTRTNRTRFPSYLNPVNTPQYLGTIVYLPQTNSLPILHWFIQNPGDANSFTGTRGCSVFYNDEFYDNIGFNLHGQSSSGFPRLSYDMDFNSGYKFRYDPDQKRVSDINLLTTYPDKAHMRNMLAYETYRDADSPYHFAFPVRVQQNGVYFSDAHFVENGDDDFLDRLGLGNGALYKMYNTFSSLTDTTIGINGNFAEKKTRKNEGNADLVALFNGVNQAEPGRGRYIYDNVNVPEMINFLAARILTGDVDCCHKNYYFFRDTEGTGEWQAFPWDVDLSFGRVWSGTPTYWDDTMYPATGLFVGNNNSMFIALFNTPAIRQMYLRRIRTLMEELLQPTNTPPANLRLEKRIDELSALIAPDQDLEKTRWPTWGGTAAGGSAISTCCTQSVALAAAIIKTNYLPQRRINMFSRTGGFTEIPATQPTNATVLFGGIEFNPASANQAQEYLQLINTNTYGVDISGWKLTGGGIDYTFRGGVVIPTNGTLYLSPDVVAFRARPIAPKGGMGLFLQGNYKGQLSARGGAVQLIDKTGRVANSTNYPGNPSLPQLYLRITEIMYHPPPAPTGSPYGTEEFEYLELKNIGPVMIDLTGVHFTNGIVFNFTGSSVTNLGMGETVLLVKNLAAFASRYGGGFNIAGQYSGSLDNAGEKLQLDDAVGEIILEFSYDNKWYPITDGPGASLVIVNENALWSTWGAKASWRPSAHDGGSPGVLDPTPVPVQSILVNELLSHSEPPLMDEIELFNPNTNDVNIGGWFISDDLNSAKKFRIPDGVMILAGNFAVFDETQFNANPTLPSSFAFSGKGDEVYLFSGDANTNLTGYFHGFQFGAAENGVSFGRHVTSIGAEHFVAQSARTFGATNAGPKVGPIVINELMYHPPDGPGGTDDQADEYIELYNLSTNDVALFNAAFPTNTWHLRKALDFDFPTNAVLPASNYLVVVSFNPANPVLLNAFQNKYGLPPNTQVLGPYKGKLNNGGDSVELYKPDATNPAPYILVDKVEYARSAPWPDIADGNGPSLHRIQPSLYGDDPTNWVAVAPTPGAPYVPGDPPVITRQPGNLNVPLGRNLQLSASATGTPPLRYQWRFNGLNLPGATSSNLVINGFQLGQAGVYNILVFNSGGFVLGTNFTIATRVGLEITSQPVSRLATNGATVIFTNIAIGTGTLRYQWRFNGGAILNATNSTLTLTNVSVANEGGYDCVVNDNFDTTTSQIATLTIVFRPVFTVQPLTQSAVAGGSVTLTVAATGTTPMGFRWRRPGTLTNGFISGFILTTPTTSVLTLTNLKSTDAATYTVAVTNVAGQAIGGQQPGLSFNAVLTVLADSDMDGLPDAWETNSALQGLCTNTFNANDPSDGARDDDGDGMSNAAEYFAGTDPCDPASNLRALVTGPNGGIVQFNAVSNRTYTVQYTDGLTPAQWTKLADVFARNVNRMESFTNSTPGTNRFYRILTPIQP